MKHVASFLLSFVCLVTLVSIAQAQDGMPDGYWRPEQVAEILGKTMTVRLDPDLTALTPQERGALNDLLEVGEIMQSLYEDALHRQAASSAKDLKTLAEDPKTADQAGALLTLFRLFEGPIATTLDNRREAFVPVDPTVPGKNVYPWGIEKGEVEAFLASHPEERSSILGERTAVRRATAENLERDLAALKRHPALDVLHPGLRSGLEKMATRPVGERLYAVPYSVAWADEVMDAYRLLRRAADTVEEIDPEFAGYLRNRARDLLSNDYESGDASWVTGRFGRLNAQIGAYETYDDALFGVKAGWSLSLLLRNEKATTELRAALGGIQEIENALPYEHHKRVRDDIPVGVYEVVADFGQARGTNTATILPNDALYSRRYGRTILLRENIMTHPELFEITLRSWQAVVADEFDDDLRNDGNFNRTLWHEIGHYLGVDRDRQGRNLDVALEGWADALEEMKADLVSLFAVHTLHDAGKVDDSRLLSVRASGIRRTLQNNKPRRDQPYQTMQLAQFNYFVESGLLEFDDRRGELIVHYDRYREVVSNLLAEVLAVQYQGDSVNAGEFFERWTAWDSDLHGVIAGKIRSAQGPRFRLVRYAALGE